MTTEQMRGAWIAVNLAIQESISTGKRFPTIKRISEGYGKHITTEKDIRFILSCIDMRRLGSCYYRARRLIGEAT